MKQTLNGSILVIIREKLPGVIIEGNPEDFSVKISEEIRAGINKETLTVFQKELLEKSLSEP